MRQFLQRALLLSLAAACRDAPDKSDEPGQLAVQWAGSARGKMSAPATAEWCAPRRRLEIRSIQGDTGIGLALYPGETIAAGRYRVVDPVKAESFPPAAAVALRWLTQSAVQGFQADSGIINLQRSAEGAVSGQIRVRARSVVDTLKISVTGTFQALAVRPETRGCPPPGEHPGSNASPGDTGVH